jgi:hypothetical protein
VASTCCSRIARSIAASTARMTKPPTIQIAIAASTFSAAGNRMACVEA